MLQPQIISSSKPFRDFISSQSICSACERTKGLAIHCSISFHGTAAAMLISMTHYLCMNVMIPPFQPMY